jgi:hypothetical protein
LLFARGPDQQVLWGGSGAGAQVVGFEEEPALEGQIPLARAGESLLAVEPEGLDLRLSVYQCK